jgi:hypothetical protein
MIRGLDLLAGALFQKEVVQVASQYAIGLFAETFGDAFPVAEEALKRGCKHLRMQLLWSDSHSFGDSDMQRVKKLAKKYNDLANKYPQASIYLSPFCEHNIKSPDKYLDATQLAAPNCTIVNTPWQGGFSGKYINEVHGDHNKPPTGRYFYSVDGGFKNQTDVMDCNVEALKAKHKGAEIFFMWSRRFNLAYSMKDPASRPLRIKEANQRKPSKDYIESISCLFEAKGKTNVPKKMTVKSHAERHGANDPKGDKLLIITPEKGNQLELKRNGKVIGKLNYYGVFDGGGFRYYAQTFGYKFGACEVWMKNRKLADINGGYRDGNFR